MSKKKIWDNWVPGVLSRSQLIEMHDKNYLTGVEIERAEDVDHSSIDLHLTNEGYLLPEGSFKPFRNETFLLELRKRGFATPEDPNGDGHFLLKRKATYLFALREGLNFDKEMIENKIFYAQATAKSTVGRVDVLARLIVDGMDHYERFVPDIQGGFGPKKMYVEITPISFPVLVKSGLAITQLRLFLGHPDNCSIPSGPDVVRACFANLDSRNDATLSVDLSNTEVEGVRACGYCAKEESDPIPLWIPEGGRHDPFGWWTVVQSDDGICNIDINRFHILRSRERLTLPSGVAVYAKATDEEIGEMRIHYAGFVHPNFGTCRNDEMDGTPLIFEVRCHNLGVILRSGEILARLQFFRMSKDEELSLYDVEKIRESKDDPYSSQELNLSKIFSLKWSSEPEVMHSGCS